MFSDLIDEDPRVSFQFDRSRSLRLFSSLDDAASDDSVVLDLQCSAHFAENGDLTSLRVVGIKIEYKPPFHIDETTLDDDGDELRVLPWLLAFMHTQLALFPRLRVAEVRAPLPCLRYATTVSPELCQLPTLGGVLPYRWGCPRADFESVETLGCDTVGVDPVTLEPSGT